MKTRLMVLGLTITTILGTGTIHARAQASFSAGIEVRFSADFYDPLSSYWSWVELGSRGR